MKVQFVNANQAAGMIKDGSTVGLIGGGSGLVEATLLHENIEKRFLDTGSPKGLTCIHALGIGDRETRGMNRFAHKGMVRRVIGGHWVWSPKMQQYRHCHCRGRGNGSSFRFNSEREWT